MTQDSLIDPVCGMDVTSDSGNHTSHQGKDYYFCSKSCLTKFESDPGTYIKETATADEHDCCGGHENHQPTHEDLKDPVCGMDVTSDSQYHHTIDGNDYYFCSESCHTKFITDADKYRIHKRSLTIVRMVPVISVQYFIPARCILKYSRAPQEVARNVAWRWMLSVNLCQRHAHNTPVRCILKLCRMNPAPAQNVAWLSNLPRLPQKRRMKSSSI